MKRLILFFTILLSVSSWAQLANFTITTTVVNHETCPSNGSISWAVSNTAPGSVISYNIINTATNAVVITTSNTMYSGLVSGTYRVVATQTLGNESNQATSNTVQVGKNLIPLVFSLSKNSDEICGNDGSFTVNVSSGRGPYVYQLLDGSNNVIASQASNVFSGLTAATYKVRVVDQCGEGNVSFITINSTPSYINDFNIRGYYGATCDQVTLTISTYNWLVKYPITLTASYTDPVTNAPVTITGPPVNFDMPTVTIPNYATVQSLNLNMTVTDACGTTKTLPKTFYYRPNVFANSYSANCGGQYYGLRTYPGDNQISAPFKVDFTSAPAGFDPAIYDPQHGQLALNHEYGSPTQPLPVGSYNYIVSDACGRTSTESFNVNAGTAPYLLFFIKNECDTALKVMNVDLQPQGYKFAQVQITAAPAEFINYYGALPYTIPEGNFDPNKKAFSLSHLPYGNYTVQYTTECGATVYTRNIGLRGDTAPVQQATIDVNCASQFKVSISNYSDSFIVQKYYPAIGKWGKAPNYYTDGTGTNYIDTGWVYEYADFNNWLNAPDGPGKYRIVPVPYYNQYSFYENNVQVTKYCDAKVLGEFEIGGNISLDNAYAFLCSNNTYNVAVSASGFAPLYYSIVSDGTASATTLVDNGTNPIFNNLTGGSYFFRVTNQCGNFITRKLDIAQLGKPGIKFNPDCATNSLKLSVEGLDYLSYQWYKASDPATILSTTNVLDLGTYDASKAGTYNVRIFTTNSTYCINNIEEIVVSPNAFTSGLAGTGQTVTITYDPTMTQLNLFDYLTPPYDGYGTWTEVSGPSSNLLVNQYWNVGLASRGTYNFLYTVTSPCTGAVSTANVIINLLKTCYNPVTNINPGIPVNHGITLLKRAGTDNKFGGSAWPLNRSSAHTVLESNTKGFVITRVPTSGLSAITTPVEGMMVYDTTAKCLKIYVVDNNNSANSGWKCFSTPSCP